ADVLTELIRSLDSDDLRRWVANLHGWTNGDQPAGRVAAFIRCRRFLHRWDRKWTRDAAQPEDGFTVPATLDERELALLCRMWDGSDEEGRALLRETARASVECSL
ncbi:MAG TPA: hypothetical protein VFO89_15605, partial [Thermoanaerobaculia bacterium]|nr:hypothetical protein [Thermoanaerobaculia bacterium]